MTIGGLNQFLAGKGVKDEIHKTSILNNKVIVVDAHLYVNSLFRSPTANQNADGSGRLISLFKNFNKKLTDSGAFPVYVFDGDYPPEKIPTQQARRKQYNSDKERHKRSLEELTRLLEEGGEPSAELRGIISRMKNPNIRNAFENPAADFLKNQETIAAANEFMRILNLRSANLSKHHIEELKHSMTELGWAWVQAPYDGEAMCAQMVKDGFADYPMSYDSDLVAMCCDKIITQITSHEVKIRNLDDILEKLEFPKGEQGKEALLSFCALLPTDFTQERLTGIGPGLAHKIIKKYNDVENIPFEKETRYEPSEPSEPTDTTATAIVRESTTMAIVPTGSKRIAKPKRCGRNGAITLTQKERKDLLRIKEIFKTVQIPEDREAYGKVIKKIEKWRKTGGALSFLLNDTEQKKPSSTRPTVNVRLFKQHINSVVEFNKDKDDKKKAKDMAKATANTNASFMLDPGRFEPQFNQTKRFKNASHYFTDSELNM